MQDVGHLQESKLEDIGTQICTIDKFVFQNKEGFRKIAKKYATPAARSGGEPRWRRRAADVPLTCR